MCVKRVLAFIDRRWRSVSRISAAVAGTNIHALLGIGGAPEGVITAAAMKCLNGEIQARLVFDPERLGVDKDKVPRGSSAGAFYNQWASTIPQDLRYE